MFLGGISENFKSNFLYNGSQYSVVEADEYDRSFLNLSPDWAVSLLQMQTIWIFMEIKAILKKVSDSLQH
jgi:hypothetical protein